MRTDGFQVVSRIGTVFLAIGLIVPFACAKQDGDYAERMNEEHVTDTAEPSPLALNAAQAAAAAEIETQIAVYATIDGQEITGYVARPVGASAGAPGVLVIQEWWGLNDNIRSMADQLAAEGYIALAVDLYNGEVATDRETAYALMSSALERPEVNRANLRQAHTYLTGELGAGETGSVGWCFGGGISLQAALALPGELDATVMFYGSVETDPEILTTLETPILGLFAADDGGISIDSVREFERQLKALDKPATIQVYDGVGHAFANPTGTNYNAEAAEDAWRRTLEFFATELATELATEPQEDDATSIDEPNDEDSESDAV